MEMTKFQKDALKEVGNIGAGKASNALARMINKRITVKMTKVRMMRIKEVSSLIGGPTIPAVGTLFDITGKIPGYFLLLSSKKTSLSLLDLINKREVGTTKIVGKFEEDTLKEIGNILVGAYISSLSDLSRVNLLESTPRLMMNNTESILNEIIKSYGYKIDYVLVVDTKLEIEKQKFTKELIFIMKPESFKILFDILIKRLREVKK